jgi:DNA-binding beta-propeller fold protein YncE
MKKIIIFILLILTISIAKSQTFEQIIAKKILLPNGWGITPIGKSIKLGDLPLNITISHNKEFAAVTNNGQSYQSIELIDLKSEEITDSVSINKAWLGLAFSSDGKYLFASGGNDNWILKYKILNKKLILSDSIILGAKLPNKISPTGIALTKDLTKLYVVTKENNSLYIVDLKSKKILKQLHLDGEGYQCLLSPDENELYVSCWGCDKIQIFDTKEMELTHSINVGDHPNDMCLTNDGKFLFVANSLDNSCSVIDVKQKIVVETLEAALFPDSPSGSTSNSVALSDNNKRLYIANADNNCLAVFDVSNPTHSKSLGYIPTGWYPTCVRVVGNTIFVANGKGFSSMANPKGPNPVSKQEEVEYQKGSKAKQTVVQYIASLFTGTMSIIPEPNAKMLEIFTKVVYQNVPYKKEQLQISDGEINNPIPNRVGSSSPIKYVFYIIKENRTYDQVLGDIPEGNGDNSLVLFGKKYTPNQHFLANEFVLLDNFYCDAEVSADGHNWSMGAYANDYLEKTWPTSYGGRGGDYEAEGRRKIANNKYFLWDLCKKYGVSYRSYGEFIDKQKPNIPSLNGHFCPYFTGWDLSVKDTSRFYQWKRDFDSLLNKNAVPRFNVIRYSNDHTAGLKKGVPTPFAYVADNDLAVGLFVDHLSHTTIWKESVVFILEDDAQNGPDHVDAHRSTAYIVGPYVKRNFVDHTIYTTSSILRTMELILGLPPMSQYDAAATPLWRSFTYNADTSAYNAIKSNVDLNELNTSMNYWQKKSETFDFSQEDKVPDYEFNKVIWFAVKGTSEPFPPLKKVAFVKEKDDD